jgi:very-short-patch-repair endonuclease
MSWDHYFEQAAVRVAQTAELRAAGATERMLTSAVRFEHLIRLRRGWYCLPGTDRATVEAVRVGGRIGCVSALGDLGIFAFDQSRTHLHLRHEASRLRSPSNRREALDFRNRRDVRLHWAPLIQPDAANAFRVGVKDALVQSLQCQHPWHALASIDNALFLGMIHDGDLAEIFAAGPPKRRSLRPLVYGRSESGQETVLRMIVHQAGLAYEIQPVIEGVGRIDMLVEGILAVEADSRTHHDGWEAHVRDRTRDAKLGSLGYPSLRPVYQSIMFEQDFVLAAIMGVLRSGGHHRIVIR